MIKCNVTVCGTVSRLASQRTNNEGKAFTSFAMNVVIPAKNGIQGSRKREESQAQLELSRVQPKLGEASKTIEVGVTMDGQPDMSALQMGKRIEVAGVLIIKKRGDAMYFNLSATNVNCETSLTEDCIKGQLEFRGKVGKSIEAKTTKSGKPYLVFSAYSAEKVNDGFEYIWVRFTQFDKEQESWLVPAVRVQAKGELELSVFNDHLGFACRVEEISEYVKPEYNPN